MPKMFFVVLGLTLVLCNMAVAQKGEVVTAMDQGVLVLVGHVNELTHKHLSRITNADKNLARCEAALNRVINNPGAKSSDIMSKKTAYINASLFAQRERQEIREHLEYVIYKYGERKESLEKDGYTVDQTDFDEWKKKIFWFAYCNSYMTLLEKADQAILEAEKREIERLQKKLNQESRKNRKLA